jgi:DNA-binding CsgD family transcriptional regulator
MTVTRDPGLRAERGSAARPLLERDGELAALHGAIGAARSGEGRLVAIEGAAGIGKTRLLGEARSLSSEFEVLSARAGELETDFAFGVVRQLFEGEIASAPTDVRAELLSGAASLAGPLLAGVPNEAGAAETSFAMLHGLYWLAANFALRQPTLLLVDDLHWSDEPSLRWLAYLVKRLEGLPLLVVVATRPPEQAGTPAMVFEIVTDPLATVIRPSALGQQSAGMLAETRFGLEPEMAFAAALREASGGNPLYLSAILDAVARQHIAPTAEQAPRLLELGGEALSRGVAIRLSRLSEAAAALLRAAAILGDQTDLSLAASLARLDKAAALKAAGALVHGDLLERDTPIAFGHPVVRSAVLEEMSAGERMDLHRRAAEVLLDNGAVPERAATYLMSTLPDRDLFVVDTLRRAAQRSLSRGAPDAAVSYLRSALDEPPRPWDRPDVLGELGIAETENFEPEAAAEHFRQALDGFDDVAQRPDLALGFVYAVGPLADRAPEAVELLRQLTARSRGSDNGYEYLDALIVAAQYDGRLYPIARDQWDIVNASDRDEPVRSGVLLAAGAIEEARRGIDRSCAIELARRAVASPTAGARERLYGVVNAVEALILAGEVADAELALRAGIEEARRAGDRYASAAYHLWRAIARVERGDLLAAEEDLDVPEVVSFAALETPLAYRAAYVAEVLVPRGEHQQAEALLSTVRAAEVQPGHRILFLRSRGCVLLETGRPEEAVTDFRAVGEIAESLGIDNPAFCPWRSHAALALHRLGHMDEARELARAELELSRRWGAPRIVGVSLRALELVEGNKTGEGLLRAAVDVLEGTPARLEHGRALIDLGAALRRANSRSEAREHLRDGIDLAHQCGATVLVTRGNEELAATGARARNVMLSGLESLTASERRVAQMAAEEVSNKEIAQALFVTVKTVEVHLSRVYRKLDIQSRRELAGALSAPAARTAVEAR